MRQPKYARIGESVRIVNPKRFVRCGYPLSLDDVYEKFNNEISDLKLKAIRAIMSYPSPPAEGIMWTGNPTLGSRGDCLISQAIASMIIRREGFGGKERQVFEEDEDSIYGVRHGTVGV